jgi:ubiquinone/menaquinone biosynthesis C-methylase UbiE
MRPQGVLGRIFGVVMERLNGRAYARAAAILAPKPGERFLEIGFGTGRLIEMLLASAPDIQVAGIDPTPTMLSVAASRRGVASAAGRVELRLGGDAPLPWGDAQFDGVAALHCFQFWPQPEATCREIVRVLRPGGRLVLVLRDHSRNAPDWLPNPLSRGGSELASAEALLVASGLRVERADPVGSSPLLVARKPVSKA